MRMRRRDVWECLCGIVRPYPCVAQGGVFGEIIVDFCRFGVYEKSRFCFAGYYVVRCFAAQFLQEEFM
jgi:hypothetical protein